MSRLPDRIVDFGDGPRYVLVSNESGYVTVPLNDLDAMFPDMPEGESPMYYDIAIDADIARDSTRAVLVDADGAPLHRGYASMFDEWRSLGLIA